MLESGCWIACVDGAPYALKSTMRPVPGAVAAGWVGWRAGLVELPLLASLSWSVGCVCACGCAEA
jgi:hypothetical protein